MTKPKTKTKVAKPVYNQKKIDAIAGKLLNEGLTSSTFTITKAKAKTAKVAGALSVSKNIAAYAKEIKKAMVAIKKHKLNAPAKRTTAKKMCSKIIKRDGVKADGTLKKGFKYAKGGRVVKVAPKKPVAKKKVGAKKKVAAKKGLKGTVSQTKKSLEDKGWEFKRDISGRGFHATKGSRKVVGTSYSNLFKKIRGY